MAIIVEEEKSSINLIRLVGWLVVLGVIAAAAYYIFFAAPGIVKVTPPASFESISPAAQFTLQPEDVLNSPAFQALKAPPFPLPTAQGPAQVGRTNPFLSP